MNDMLTAKKYFDKGFELHMDGKLNEAIENYLISIEFHPTAEAHTYLGWVYSMKGEYEKAIEECKTAIALDPDYGNPYNDIGSYLISLNRLEEAIVWLEGAINAKNYIPRHYPYLNLGFIYEKRGEWFTALGYYKKALELQPDSERAKKSTMRLTALLN